MKNLKHYLIPSFLILLSVVLLLVLKKTPSKKMWDDYSVFYIEETTDENYIENLFKNYNIKDFISQILQVNLQDWRRKHLKWLK